MFQETFPFTSPCVPDIKAFGRFLFVVHPHAFDMVNNFRNLVIHFPHFYIPVTKRGIIGQFFQTISAPFLNVAPGLRITPFSIFDLYFTIL